MHFGCIVDALREEEEEGGVEPPQKYVVREV